MSAVVIGKLLYGLRSDSRFGRNGSDSWSFLDNHHVTFVPVGPITADRYSRISAALRAKGNPIPTNDVWTAAHAMERGPTWYRRTGNSKPWMALRGCA